MLYLQKQIEVILEEKLKKSLNVGEYIELTPKSSLKYLPKCKENIFPSFCEITKIVGDDIYITATTPSLPINPYMPNYKSSVEHFIINKEDILIKLSLIETIILYWKYFFNNNGAF